jgi:hypothetical protein
MSMMMKMRCPKQAGFMLPGILLALLIWFAGVGVAKAACNAGNILYNDLEIVLSKDVVCVGGTVTATVKTTTPAAFVKLTSDSSKISITPTDGLRTPAEFTITGVTKSDLPGDVPLLATIISGEETDPEVVSCVATSSITVLKVDIVVDLEDQEVNGVRSGLKQDTLRFDLNGNMIPASNLTLQPTTVTVDGEQITTNLKVTYLPSCSELNLPGSNTVKVDIDDMVNNHMDQVVNTFLLP